VVKAKPGQPQRFMGHLKTCFLFSASKSTTIMQDISVRCPFLYGSPRWNFPKKNTFILQYFKLEKENVNGVENGLLILQDFFN
jgi:hypothetical protein